MKAQDALQAAIATLELRGKQNGYDSAQERSAADIAALFNWHTDKVLSEEDAWRFMICLKEVRLKRQRENGGDITDTLIDLLSYTALLAECITEKS